MEMSRLRKSAIWQDEIRTKGLETGMAILLNKLASSALERKTCRLASSVDLAAHQAGVSQPCCELGRI